MCNGIFIFHQLPSLFKVNFSSLNAWLNSSIFLSKHLQNPFETGKSGNSGVLKCSVCCEEVSLEIQQFSRSVELSSV